MKPIMSAIVSCYNSARFIEGRINNLIEQSLYKNGMLEIIVIDSNSPQHESVIVHNQVNSVDNVIIVRTDIRETVYGAWNRGIALSRGQYVINANTDDRFAPDALELMLSVLEKDHEIDAVYGNWLVTKVENDTFNSNNKFVFSYPDFYPPLLLYFQISSHAALYRKRVFEILGGYDYCYKVFGDRDFMLRFSCCGLKAKHIDDIVGLYLESPSSVERSESSAGIEFDSIRLKYILPQNFVKLFGCHEVPDYNTLSQLYAVAGSIGKDFYSWDGTLRSDIEFAEQLLMKSLAINQNNIMVLNNLAIIEFSKNKIEHALNLLRRANDISNNPYKKIIQNNIDNYINWGADVSKYTWIEPDVYQTNDILNDNKDKNCFKSLVSVIIPTFNRPELVVSALNSLIAQDYPTWEAIVVNDGGASIKECIETLDPQGRIKYVEHPRSNGPSAARNTALRMAQGEIICYLDDDDLYLPDHLSTVVKALRENPDAFVYTDSIHVVEELREGQRHELSRDNMFEHSIDQHLRPRECLYVYNFIPINTWAHTRKIQAKAGFFDETIESHEDWEYLLRLVCHCEIVHVPIVTTEVRERQGTVDNRTRIQSRRNVSVYKKIYKKYNDLKCEFVIKRRRLQLDLLEQRVFHKLLNNINYKIKKFVVRYVTWRFKASKEK